MPQPLAIAFGTGQDDVKQITLRMCLQFFGSAEGQL